MGHPRRQISTNVPALTKMPGMATSESKGNGLIRPTRRTFLSASAVTAAAVAVPGLAGPAAAGEFDPGNLPGSPITPQPPDPDLLPILREIDQDRIEAIVRRLADFGTRHTASSQDDPVRGIGAARDWIFDQLQSYADASGGRMTVVKQSFVQSVTNTIPVPTPITNVIATLRGDAAPARIYVITGHYDSRCTDVLNFTADAPGADDDASGVAVLMELARVLAPRHLDATLVFAAVAGEEQGLYGSTFMAQQMKADGADVHGMFSNDIVGSSTADDGTTDASTLRMFVEGVPTSETPAEAARRLSIGGENDSASRQLGRFVLNVAENGATGMNIRMIYRRDRYRRASDHVPFLQQGYPAGRFTEPHEDFAHQHQDVRVDETGKQFGDLPEFCDFDYIARVAKVNGAMLWSLSQAPASPRGVALDITQLTNKSRMTWQPGTEPDLVGYEVVWRETTAPEWQFVIPVGNVTDVTINLSKDNVFLGVRAVDADGHRSPVAFAR
jgi:hypothetical protein